MKATMNIPRKNALWDDVDNLIDMVADHGDSDWVSNGQEIYQRLKNGDYKKVDLENGMEIIQARIEMKNKMMFDQLVTI